jgi:DNA-binding protein HU-beta
MNQSELIEKVAQVTQLNQAVADQAVKAVVNAILDALVAGEAVRVSGLGIFNVAARPAREGRNPQTGETIQIAASKAVRFRAGKAVKDALNPPTQKGAPREEACTTKEICGAEVNPLDVLRRLFLGNSAFAQCLPNTAVTVFSGLSLRLAPKNDTAG